MKRKEEARFNINQRVSYSFVLWAKKGGCLRRQSEWKSRYKGHQSTSFLSKRLRVVIGSHMSLLLKRYSQGQSGQYLVGYGQEENERFQDHFHKIQEITSSIYLRLW